MSENAAEPQNKEHLPAVQESAPVDVPIVNGMLQPTNLDGLWRLAVIMADSGMVPEAYKRKPAAIFVACSWGAEIGLSFNNSLQSIAVIDGKPSIYGDAGLALVRGSGKLKDIHEYFTGEFGHDDYTAHCDLTRQGEERVQKSEFSIADAKVMGKWMKETQNGKASVWMKHPTYLAGIVCSALAFACLICAGFINFSLPCFFVNCDKAMTIPFTFCTIAS